jgi:hypothetical protein
VSEGDFIFQFLLQNLSLCGKYWPNKFKIVVRFWHPLGKYIMVFGVIIRYVGKFFISVSNRMYVLWHLQNLDLQCTGMEWYIHIAKYDKEIEKNHDVQ